jgi:circadian clock protein KaiB
MKMSKRISETTKVKRKDGNGSEKYILQLFVTGILPNSARAVVNIKSICEKYIKGMYELEIIDIYQQPGLALKEDIIDIPMLIKKLPLPELSLIGDMSDNEKVLNALSLFN